MAVHGVLAEEEPLGDHLIVEAVRDEAQHFDFSAGKARWTGRASSYGAPLARYSRRRPPDAGVRHRVTDAERYMAGRQTRRGPKRDSANHAGDRLELGQRRPGAVSIPACGERAHDQIERDDTVRSIVERHATEVPLGRLRRRARGPIAI
jgi:hypothetical protein